MVETDAIGHLLDLLLAKAGRGAMLARLSAFDASFDARLVLFVGHGIVLLESET
jgi:hypothetical protein